MQYFMLNKPPGCLSSRVSTKERPTVYSHVPDHYPALPHAGRLDYNSEGLLLFTDDGRLTQALLNKKFREKTGCGPIEAIKKVYHVKIHEILQPDDPRLALLEIPFKYPDGFITTPAEVSIHTYRKTSTWIQFIINEGRNRQIRRLCKRSHLLINKLRRVQLGPLYLGDLTMRWCRPLTIQEIFRCYDVALPGEPYPKIDPIIDPPPPTCDQKDIILNI